MSYLISLKFLRRWKRGLKLPTNAEDIIDRMFEKRRSCKENREGNETYAYNMYETVAIPVTRTVERELGESNT